MFRYLNSCEQVKSIEGEGIPYFHREYSINEDHYAGNNE
jgi:hypothetical protein